MNILSLFYSFVNHFNNILKTNISFHSLEAEISSSTTELNLNSLKLILEYIDSQYKASNERKSKYYVHATRPRTLITSLGLLHYNKTYYKSKKKLNGKYIFFSYLEDFLGIDKWAKMTLRAEVSLINNALHNGYSWAGLNTIPNSYISRQTISKKIKAINYNYVENIIPSSTPNTLYIEADEVHANLQRPNRNKIVPVILSHEGHKELFVKKKQLLNPHYIASSILKTDKLWDEAYKYLDTKYNLDKLDYLFISGDGGSWIKGFIDVFPKAIFILDKFHYRKALSYILKKDVALTKLADNYLRNNMVDSFNKLVNYQIKEYPHQKKYMKQKHRYLLNNITGIVNQQHPAYKCPCSMEGHISNKYAKFITSRPHAYSEAGLENIVQLLTMKANKITLTEEIYYKFKYGESIYKKLNLETFITNFRDQANAMHDSLLKYQTSYSVDNSSFSSHDNYRLDYFLNHRL